MAYSNMGTKPGLRDERIWTSSITIGGSDADQAAGSVMIIEISGTIDSSGSPYPEPYISGGAAYFGAGSKLMVNSYYAPWVSVGSGTASKVQNLVQAGSGVTGAGSTGYWVFPTAYSAAPTVTVSSFGEAAVTSVATLGTVAAGSFEVFTTDASQAFNWIAVGLG